MNCGIRKQRGMSEQQLCGEQKHNQNKHHMLEQKA